MPIPPADVFGVVYIIENAQQYWSGALPELCTAAHHLTSLDLELEDMLNVADGLTLERLDATLRRFISFCAAYHGECVRSRVCARVSESTSIQSSTYRAHSRWSTHATSSSPRSCSSSILSA